MTSYATQALETSFLGEGTGKMTLPGALTLFKSAVTDVDPTIVFTSADVARWATTYHEISKELRLPDSVLNAYSVGKYLQIHYEKLGLTQVGKYGNRMRYMVMSNAEGE